MKTETIKTMNTMKTPISYYGGKQTLCSRIAALIPTHSLYCEPFFGGGAVFFAKPKGMSQVEVINDTNKELINFYKVVQNDFVSLEKEVRITLHSRDLHRKASVIYNNPDMFNEVKRAWAVWVLATQSFASSLDNAWGYDIAKRCTSKKVMNKRDSFTEEYAIRLQDVQIECTDAIRIITSRDTEQSFFYCDPPYFQADMGHYAGYTINDFETLLQTLLNIKGKFILSSYPSPILEEYVKKGDWSQKSFEMQVSVAKVNRPKKTEVLTANFSI